MPLELYTARLGYRPKPGADDPPWLDVSLQGNLRRAEQGKAGGQDGLGFWFAPSPDLLYPYLSARKFNRLRPGDWARYAAGYLELMRARYRDPVTRQAFDQVLARDRLVLLCFCKEAEACAGATCTADACAHCHRSVLAIDVLAKLGAVHRGELPVPARATPELAPGDTVFGESSGRCTSFAMRPTEPGAELVTGHISGGRRKRCKGTPSCSSWSSRLCDFPLKGAKAGKTCDLPLCARCATSIGPEVDYCGVHARMAQASAAQGSR